MDLLGHCTWCKQPITGDYVADSDGSREHEWCHGLRMKQERNDAREQLRGAVALLGEVADSALAFEDDERLKWVEVQIDRPTWDALAPYRSGGQYDENARRT